MNKKQEVRLKVWVHYDSQSGYVWLQVYSSAREAAIDENMNHPIKVMELTSEPYFRDDTGNPHSFGTEVFVNVKREKEFK